MRIRTARGDDAEALARAEQETAASQEGLLAARPHEISAEAVRARIRDLAERGLCVGVEGDAHRGRLVQHLSRVRRDPTVPNLRQVHLIHSELHDELNAAGFDVRPGAMGENVTTRGVELLALPVGSRLHLGVTAVVELTGLRNPCAQLDRYRPGLMAAVLDRDRNGNLVRKAGVMAVVLAGGEVHPGEAIEVELPRPPHVPLAPV